MKRDAIRAGQPLPTGDGRGENNTPPSSDGAMAVTTLRALEQALAEIARIERAEERAKHLIEALERRVLACLAEMERMDAAGWAAQAPAFDAMLRELERLGELLPIERAFRADEKDRAGHRIDAVRRVLQNGRGAPDPPSG